MTSFYGSFCANNGKGAPKTPETLPLVHKVAVRELLLLPAWCCPPGSRAALSCRSRAGRPILCGSARGRRTGSASGSIQPRALRGRQSLARHPDFRKPRNIECERRKP
eukprot:1188381-Prorocentrum_minimum.AAC.4